MKDERHINLDQIASIETHLKNRNPNYKHGSEYKKLFGFIKIVPDGFFTYVSFKGDVEVDIEEIQYPSYVEGKAVYFHPHLVYHMSDGSRIAQYFNNEGELRNQIITLRSKINLMRIEEY